MSKHSIRILHTADWHLGKKLHGADLTPAHTDFLDWLIKLLQEEDVDVLIMAGDIFDRGFNPPPEAERLLYDKLEEMAAIVGLETILITGNHDYSPRLSYGNLLHPGLHIRSGTRDLAQPVLLQGIASFPVALYPIPFLESFAAGHFLGCETKAQPVLSKVCDLARADLKGRRSEDPGYRSILIAHAFVTGGKVSENAEKYVGTADEIKSETFEGFDYVAMGHLHRPHSISENIRYSGSPLALHFSEVPANDSGQESGKSVSLVTLDASGTTEVEEIAVPQGGSTPVIRRMEGELTEILGRSASDDWVEIALTDELVPDGARSQLLDRFPNLLHLTRKRSGDSNADTASGSGRGSSENTNGPTAQSVEELVEAFFHDSLKRPLDREERDLVRLAIEETGQTGSSS